MSILTDPYALTLLQGKTFRVVFTMTNPGATPAPVDLTGYGATFTIYNRPGGTSILTVNDQTTIDPISGQPFASDDTPVVVQPNGNTGQVSVRLGADMTLAITRTGAYDATIYKLNDPTEVQPLAAGPLLVLPYGADISELSSYT